MGEPLILRSPRLLLRPLRSEDAGLIAAYRSLAEFHETDVGRFHRWLSLIVLGLALTFSAGGLLAWWNKPGEWLLVIASGVSIVLLWLDARDVQNGPRGHSTAAGAPEEWWLTGDTAATRSTRDGGY